jgi:hypothetical protein
MKNILTIITLAFIIFSCTKENEQPQKDVSGHWLSKDFSYVTGECDSIKSVTPLGNKTLELHQVSENVIKVKVTGDPWTTIVLENNKGNSLENSVVFMDREYLIEFNKERTSFVFSDIITYYDQFGSEPCPFHLTGTFYKVD